MIDPTQYDDASPLTPAGFAGLSVTDQYAYQVSQADYYQQLWANGVSLTKAQSDFVDRIYKKNFGSVPNVSLLDNLVEGAQGAIKGAGSAIGGFELKTLLLPLLVIIGVIVLVFAVKK